MRTRVASAGALVAAVVGLGASIASLVDYLAPQAAFCAETGCETVRASAWSHPLGVPMPVVGIAFFVTMIALCFVERPRVRVALAATGAAWAVALIGLQAFVIHAWCKLCMIADPAAIAGGIAVVAGARTLRARWLAPAVPLVGATVLALSLFAHKAPEVMPADTPAFVVKAQQPGVVTVVELLDFECPFCRKLAPNLAAALQQAHVPVRVVRKMVPLPMHPHALPAALAWCCAAAQGKGDAMADALFAAPPDELTTDGCEKIAAQVGCDLDRYHRDLPAMVGIVAADMLDARAGNVHSLPTVFVGPQRVVGANHSPADLIAMIERAAR